MEELLQNTIIQLLGIVIGGILAIASAYATLFVAKATQKAKVEIEKLNDERQRKIIIVGRTSKIYLFTLCTS